jgi:hypothetical protein
MVTTACCTLVPCLCESPLARAYKQVAGFPNDTGARRLLPRTDFLRLPREACFPLAKPLAANPFRHLKCWTEDKGERTL